MNRALKRTFLFLCAVVVGCAATTKAPVKGPSKRVIATPAVQALALSELYGLTSTPQRRYDKATLFEAINGAAELYNAYGFVQMVTRRYKTSDSDSAVQVYDLGRAINAFGMFWRERFDGAVSLVAGNEGAYADPALCSAYSGRLYIKVVPQKGELKAEGCALLLKGVLAKISHASGKAATLALLPAVGRQAQSVRYTAQSFLGVRELSGALHARYGEAGEKGHVRFVLIPAPEQSAATRWATLSKRLTGDGVYLKTTVPFRGDVVLSLSSKGQIFGVAEAGSLAKAKALLGAWAGVQAATQ